MLLAGGDLATAFRGAARTRVSQQHLHVAARPQVGCAGWQPLLNTQTEHAAEHERRAARSLSVALLNETVRLGDALLHLLHEPIDVAPQLRHLFFQPGERGGVQVVLDVEDAVLELLQHRR